MPMPKISDESLGKLRDIFEETVKAVQDGKIEPAASKSSYRNDVFDRLQGLGALKGAAREEFFGAMNAMLRDEVIKPRVAEAMYENGGDGKVYESDINYYLTSAYGGHKNAPQPVRRGAK